MSDKEFTDTFVGTSNVCLTVNVYPESDNVEVLVDGNVITVPKTWFIRAAQKVNDTLPERWALPFGKSFEDALVKISETPMIVEMIDVVSTETQSDLKDYDPFIQMARKLVAAEREVDDRIKAQQDSPDFPIENYRRKRAAALGRIERMRKIGVDRIPQVIFRNERIIMAMARTRYYYPDDDARLQRQLDLFNSEFQEPDEKKETVQ